MPALIVTPLAGATFFGIWRGPFLPELFQYQVSSSSGTISYAISTPAWLTASPSSGVADTSGATITLRVNSGALDLSPGTYGPGIAFKNVTNGLGGTVRRATLKIQTWSPLIDGRGGYLVDDAGGRLLGNE